MSAEQLRTTGKVSELIVPDQTCAEFHCSSDHKGPVYLAIMHRGTFSQEGHFCFECMRRMLLADGLQFTLSDGSEYY